MLNVLKIFNYDFQTSIINKLRQERFKILKKGINQLKKTQNHLRILDIGGTQKFWENMNYIKLDKINITLLNTKKEEVLHPNFHSIVGDATDLSYFKKNEFDIVVAHSLIEHIPTAKKQSKLSKEIIRISKYYFVETPNKCFPIEPHFRLPFVQFAPANFKKFLLTKTKLVRNKKWAGDQEKNFLKIKPISKKEFKKMFPDGKIYYEKYLGLTCSFTAYNFNKKMI